MIAVERQSSAATASKFAIRRRPIRRLGASACYRAVIPAKPPSLKYLRSRQVYRPSLGSVPFLPQQKRSKVNSFSRSAIKSAPSMSMMLTRPEECAAIPSPEKTVDRKKHTREFSRFRFTIAANGSSSAAAIGFASQFTSDRYTVPSNENAPSNCSSAFRKDTFGSRSNKSDKSYMIFSRLNPRP